MVSRNASDGLVLKIAIPGARASESSLFKSLNIDSLFICLKKEWVWFEELPEIDVSCTRQWRQTPRAASSIPSS
ncbi:unnamed protein product [Durusdinium trenchii]|uniref:Uncharacterized protein n=1 Tax=Durusdinium trenchii TaxID=1381693 RepID=A0ABP0J0V0_9DINO